MRYLWYAIAWLIVFVIMLIIEIMTLGLATIWFCAGALLAMITALLGGNVVVQILVFVVVSGILMLALRPWATKYINKRTQKTNVDSLIGKVARVTTQIDNRMEKGSAMLNGLEWTARSAEDNTIIPEGALAEVVAVSGVKLILKVKNEQTENLVGGK